MRNASSDDAALWDAITSAFLLAFVAFGVFACFIGVSHGATLRDVKFAASGSVGGSGNGFALGYASSGSACVSEFYFPLAVTASPSPTNRIEMRIRQGSSPTAAGQASVDMGYSFADLGDWKWSSTSTPGYSYTVFDGSNPFGIKPPYTPQSATTTKWVPMSDQTCSAVLPDGTCVPVTGSGSWTTAPRCITLEGGKQYWFVFRTSGTDAANRFYLGKSNSDTTAGKIRNLSGTDTWTSDPSYYGSYRLVGTATTAGNDTWITPFGTGYALNVEDLGSTGDFYTDILLFKDFFFQHKPFGYAYPLAGFVSTTKTATSTIAFSFVAGNTSTYGIPVTIRIDPTDPDVAPWLEGVGAYLRSFLAVFFAAYPFFYGWMRLTESTEALR